jgi:prepilin-type N-terminal cleavage/methylation domain-containing protein
MLQKLRGSNEKGFTLIELMIVIAIIGILAAIAIPNFIKYRERSYNSSANSDAKNAYTAAQAYFIDYPTAGLDVDMLKEGGYQQSQDVSLILSASTMGTLQYTTKHDKGSRIYTVDSAGIITHD